MTNSTSTTKTTLVLPVFQRKPIVSFGKKAAVAGSSLVCFAAAQSDCGTVGSDGSFTNLSGVTSAKGQGMNITQTHANHTGSTSLVQMDGCACAECVFYPATSKIAQEMGCPCGVQCTPQGCFCVDCEVGAAGNATANTTASSGMRWLSNGELMPNLNQTGNTTATVASAGAHNTTNTNSSASERSSDAELLAQLFGNSTTANGTACDVAATLNDTNKTAEPVISFPTDMLALNQTAGSNTSSTYNATAAPLEVEVDAEETDCHCEVSAEREQGLARKNATELLRVKDWVKEVAPSSAGTWFDFDWQSLSSGCGLTSQVSRKLSGFWQYQPADGAFVGAGAEKLVEKF